MLLHGRAPRTVRKSSACRLLVPVEVQRGATCELAQNQRAPAAGLDREPEGYHRRMADAATPMDDEGTVEIEDAPGWRYLPFGGSDDQIEVTVVRDGDGCQLRFTVPAIVQRGAELGGIARIVIAAQERAENSEGLGA